MISNKYRATNKKVRIQMATFEIKDVHVEVEDKETR